jgi:hypothetical protein
MRTKRTTVPDGIPRAMRPPTSATARREITLDHRATPPALARAVIELARGRRRLRHRPTLAQLRTMVRLDGRQPCSYRLDPAANWLPESLPVDFPHGASGLCLVHRGGELVVLPDACGFSLT